MLNLNLFLTGEHDTNEPEEALPFEQQALSDDENNCKYNPGSSSIYKQNRMKFNISAEYTNTCYIKQSYKLICPRKVLIMPINADKMCLPQLQG